MRMVDVKCTKCDAIRKDVLLRERNEAGDYIYPTCELCGEATERVHLGTSAGVVDDSIPGGLYIENALCHPDGTPRRFDSKAEMHRYAKEHGWQNHVEHQPSKGSDRNRQGHTQRFV